MSILGVDKEIFEQFKVAAENRFKGIEEELRLKATDSEQIAKEAASRALTAQSEAERSADSIKAALSEIEEYRTAAHVEIESLKAERAQEKTTNAALTEGVKNTQVIYAQLVEMRATVDAQVAEVGAKLQTIANHLTQSEKLPDAVAQTEKLLTESKAVSESIGQTLKHALGRKTEIDALHKKILGEDLDGDDGKTQHIDGLKDELDNSYKKLTERAEGLNGEVDSAVAEVRAKQEGLLTETQSTITQVVDQLKGLLPGGLAAGLSAAYEKKTDEEKKSLSEFQESFKNTIYAMVGTALIPFFVDIWLLVIQQKDLVQVVKDTPSMIVAILPLYFPTLWMAYATNKKVNLSKRLIEEYTHKAVLGKTFSGLSNQIESLPANQDAVRQDLRIRLLFNVLQVSAENPGKLITNYNKADHPLMEALENSAKLGKSVELLAKIPGFAAITKRISEVSDEAVQLQTEAVEKGLAAQKALVEPTL